jgi:hypothetical protein
LDPATSADDEEDATSVITEIKEGLAYVRTQTWLWGTFLAATLAYLIFWGPAEVLLPLRVKNDLGGSAGELGLILALGGVGAMVTAVVMGNRSMPRRHMTFMYVVWTVSTLAIAGYGLARLPWQAMVFCFAFNALESAGLIVWITTKQRLVPQRLMGRVSSFDWFISTALVPLSYAATGPIAKLFGAQATLVGAGLIGGAVTLAFLFVPGMRDIERRGLLAGVHLESAIEPTLEAETAPPYEPPAPAPLASGALTLVAPAASWPSGSSASRHRRPSCSSSSPGSARPSRRLGPTPRPSTWPRTTSPPSRRISRPGSRRLGHPERLVTPVRARPGNVGRVLRFGPERPDTGLHEAPCLARVPVRGVHRPARVGVHQADQDRAGLQRHRLLLAGRDDRRGADVEARGEVALVPVRARADAVRRG